MAGKLKSQVYEIELLKMSLETFAERKDIDKLQG